MLNKNATKRMNPFKTFFIQLSILLVMLFAASKFGHAEIIYVSATGAFDSTTCSAWECIPNR